MHYQGKSDFYFFVNEDKTPYHGTVTLPALGSCYWYDPWNNRLYPAFPKGRSLDITLKPLHSAMLVLDEADPALLTEPVFCEGEEIALAPWLRSTCDGTEYPNFGEPKTVTLPDTLAQEQPTFSGFVRYESRFAAGEDQKITLELTEAWEGVEVFVNGQSAGIQIAPPYRYDLTKLTRPGENALTIEVAITLERQCYQTSAALAAKVRQLDSTRPVAGALCSFFNGLNDTDNGKFWQSLMESAMASGGSISNLDSAFGRGVWNDYTEAFAAPWDIVGYNYLNYHYAEAAELFPNRVILATESKPREVEQYWADVEKYPFLIGDFEWTSHDYLGEAGIGKVLHVEKDQVKQASQAMSYSQYPWRCAQAGDFDLCGFPKPQLAFKRIVWGSKETYIAVEGPRFYGKAELVGRYGWTDCAHSWTWPVEPGSPVEVEVYSSAEEVELILNGKSLGKAKAKNTAMFTLTYEPGTLEAVSYTDGQEVSRDRLETYGTPVGLKLTPDKTVLAADGDSLCFVKVEAVDAEGNPIPYVEVEAAASVEGAAVLAAFGTGRACTEENYTAGKTTLYRGTALAILRSGVENGSVKLTVSGEGLAAAELEIRVE